MRASTAIIISVLCSVVLVCLQSVAGVSLSFQRLSDLYLPYTYNPNPQFALGQDAAEQMAYDALNKVLYSVGHNNIHVIDMNDVSNMNVLYHTSYPNVDITDVELCGDYVFVAFDNLDVREDGHVNVYKLYNDVTGLELVHEIIVGEIPDMIHPTSDCSKVYVAIEAEPYPNQDTARLVDNPGSVNIITFATDPAGSYTIKRLGFEQFNDRYDALAPSGVRFVYRDHGNTFSNDVEPEYIAFNEEETLAYIGLQENNAIVVVDMQTEAFIEMYGLGYKNWSEYTIDPSDRDGGMHMAAWPVYGMYQPDSIKVLRHQGADYVITANEGDSKDYTYFSEESRVKDLQLSSDFGTAIDAHALQSNSKLGRLKVTTENGMNDAGTYDRLYAFGARSFSIRRADTMQLVYDSGDELAHKTALLFPEVFNANFDPQDTVSDDRDTRSDDKGVETESIAMGKFGHYTVLFIGNERPGTIAVYTIDDRLDTVSPRFHTLLHSIDRTDDTWENLYNDKAVSMLDPEDMKFVPASDSPNGEPLLLVSGSQSGTITAIQVNVDLDGEVVGRR